jgi:hypothetical protein
MIKAEERNFFEYSDDLFNQPIPYIRYQGKRTIITKGQKSDTTDECPSKV